MCVGLLSCLACQGVSCCAGAACSVCGKVVPCSKSVATRGVYAALFFLASLIQYVLNNASYKILHWIPMLGLCSDNDNQKFCVGALSAARVCFAMVVFHLGLAVVMIRVKNSNDVRASVQDGWWPVKFLAICGLTVVGYFIPNEFFVIFGYICLFGAAIFILIQLILLIDFAYTWAEAWVGKYQDEESKIWSWLLLCSTVLMYAACAAGTVLIYIFFYKGSSCWMNVMFPTINILSCIVFSFLSVYPRVQEAHPRGTGLLQSAVVSLYSTYLIWSAVNSEPDDDSFHCNPWSGTGQSLSTLLMGAAFTIVAVCFSTVRLATRGDDFLGGRDTEAANSSESKMLINNDDNVNSDGVNENSIDVDDISSSSTTATAAADDEKEQVAYNYTFFHITFLLGSMFVYMLVTDWQMISGISNDNYKVDHGFVAVWVKIVTSWLVAMLYIWTLIAPMIFPNRDWS